MDVRLGRGGLLFFIGGIVRGEILRVVPVVLEGKLCLTPLALRVFEVELGVEVHSDSLRLFDDELILLVFVEISIEAEAVDVVIQTVLQSLFD